MSDSVIDAIRAVDPCPEELAPPPIDVVRRRLNAEPAVSARPARSRRGPSLSALFVAVSSAAVLAVAVWAFAVLGHGQRSDRAAGPAPRRGGRDPLPVTGTRGRAPALGPRRLQ